MKIRFFGERVISIRENQTILEASLSAGINHFHVCGGKGKCTTCRIMVLEGAENLSAPNKKELKLRDAIKMTPDLRLACQTTMNAEHVVVERIIRDESDLSQYLSNTGTDPDYVGLRAVGEEKYLVLFFLDIRNFTPFIETYLPFDVMFITRKLFNTFDKVVHAHNGKIIENVGDELYVVFGLEGSIRHAADAAISTGHAILAELDMLNKEYFVKYFNREFEIGIGIHAGKVIIGEFTINGHAKTNVMGLAVNIASRIQDATKEFNNSFIVSEEVIKHSSHKVLNSLLAVSLRGSSNRYVIHLLGNRYKKRA